jgi:threonine dehydrogenase-like Zn-dependent dehydrogenase
MAVLNSYANALDLVAKGFIDTEALITDTLPLEQYPDALAKMRSGSGLKIQVLPGGGRA